MRAKGLFHFTRLDLGYSVSSSVLGAGRIARQVKSWTWTQLSTEPHRPHTAEWPTENNAFPRAAKREKSRILLDQ